MHLMGWQELTKSREEQKKAITGLIIYRFFRGLSIGFYQAFFGYYMKDLGYRMSEIGGVASAGGLVSFFLLPAIGSLIDYYSSRATTILTGFLGVIALALLGFRPSLKLFILSYTLYMMAFLLGQPARSTYLARAVSRAELGFYMGIVSFAFSLASIIGPPLGGYLIKAIGYRRSFLAFSTSWLVGLLFFWALSPRLREGIGRLPTYSEITLRYRNTFRIPRDLRWTVLIISTDRAGWSLWIPLLTAHLYNFGYSKEDVGMIYGVYGIVRTASMLAWGKITDIMGSYKVLFSSEIMGAVGALMIFKPISIYYTFICMSLIGLSVSAWIPSYNKFVAELVPPERYGEAYTVTNAYRGLAGIPTPYIGGYIYDNLGVLPLFLASSLLIVTAGIMFLTIGKRELARRAVLEALRRDVL
jgi:MFS family permease